MSSRVQQLRQGKKRGVKEGRIRGVSESRDFRARGTVTGLKEAGRVGIPRTAESWMEEQACLFLCKRDAGRDVSKLWGGPEGGYCQLGSQGGCRCLAPAKTSCLGLDGSKKQGRQV